MLVFARIKSLVIPAGFNSQKAGQAGNAFQQLQGSSSSDFSVHLYAPSERALEVQTHWMTSPESVEK